ncbi:MAG: DMT family transporter [Verrucomicrobia bacterium]|nr:DMT family transporter [Verrucomicrobiota bacterium]
MLPAFLTTVLWAISAVSANRMTRLIGGIEANFWRITLATLLLAVWAHGFGQGLSGQAFPYFLLSGFVGFGLGDLALYQALPRIGSRLSIMIVHCLATPFAAVTEWWWLGTSLGVIQIGCSATILLGVSLALAPSKHLDLTPRKLATGAVYGAIAGLGQAIGAVLSRKAYQVADLANEPIDGMSAAYQRIIAGWVIAALSLVAVKQGRKWVNGKTSDPFSPFTSDKWRLVWPWIVANALSGPTLGVSCFQWALATTATGIVLPIVATTPLVVIPFAKVVEGEQPTRRSLIGGVIAVIGAVALTIVAT